MRTEEGGGALENTAAEKAETATGTEPSAQECPQTPGEGGNPRLAWALRYAMVGLAVLPLHTPREDGRCDCRRDCDSIGKHPRILRGKDDATTEADEIRRWWRMWPQANVGVVPPEGVVVLDIDIESPWPDDTDEIEEKAARLRPIPKTRLAGSGGGGFHLWFGYAGPHGGRLYERGQAVSGIDVKGNNGYLVAPPSRHVCGSDYRWLELHPEAPAPDHIRQLLRPPKRTTARRDGTPRGGSLDALVAFVARSELGERNNRLYWACCRAHENGLDVNPLVDVAVQRSGLPRASAEATAASAASAPSWKEGRSEQ